MAGGCFGDSGQTLQAGNHAGIHRAECSPGAVIGGRRLPARPRLAAHERNVVEGRKTIMSELQEATKEFLIETHESLAQLDLDLVTLEKDPTERATMAQVFRTLHTLKGTAGFLGL